MSRRRSQRSPSQSQEIEDFSDTSASSASPARRRRKDTKVLPKSSKLSRSRSRSRSQLRQAVELPVQEEAERLDDLLVESGVLDVDQRRHPDNRHVVLPPGGADGSSAVISSQPPPFQAEQGNRLRACWGALWEWRPAARWCTTSPCSTPATATTPTRSHTRDQFSCEY